MSRLVETLAILALMSGAALAKDINVQSFGAKGDSTAADTQSEQAAIDAAKPGDAVVWPKTSGCYSTEATLTVKKPLTLRGPGQICMKAGSGPLLKITSGDVKLDRLDLRGPQNGSYVDAQRAVEIAGTFHPGAAPDFISGITITNSTISRWGGYGIHIAYVNDFTIRRNHVFDIGYAGIGVLSGRNGRISQNAVENVGAEGLPGSTNSYGIFISRASGDSGELLSQPRSENVVVSTNRVRNVPSWECLDTHGGANVRFIANTGFGCAIGLMIGPSAERYAPLNAYASGNDLDSGKSDGSAQYGLVFQGVYEGEMATGRIAGGTVLNYGAQANGSRGSAVLIEATSDLAISDLSIINPSPIGVLFAGKNRNASARGLTIRNPWTNTASIGEVEGFYVRGKDNSITLDGNRIEDDGSKEALIRLTTPGKGTAIRLNNVPGDHASLGQNPSNAALPLVKAETVIDLIGE